MKLDQKKQIVEKLRDQLAASRVVIVTDYKGLSVAQLNDLRRQLKNSEVEFRVVKNTLLTRASDSPELEKLQGFFKGPSAVALGFKDPVAPAKVLTKFAEDNKALEIKGGVLGGKRLDPAAIKALSALPAREVLLAQMLAVMNAVPAGFVRALADFPRRMLNVLNAIKDQKAAA